MSVTIHTPEAILSYPQLDEPRAGPDGGEAKYSAVFIFEEGTDLTEIQKAIVEAAKERWGEKATGMLKNGQLRNPLRSDWQTKAGYPENSRFLSARSKVQPMAVQAWGVMKNGEKVPAPIEDITGELYPGARVRASLRFYAYDNVSKGVGVGLGNIQKLGEGERLDGRVSAQAEFGVLQEEPVDLPAETGTSDADSMNELLGI